MPSRVIRMVNLDACKIRGRNLGIFRMLLSENLALRQQVIVLQRTAPKRLYFNAIDRLIFVALYRLFPDLGDGGPWAPSCTLGGSSSCTSSIFQEQKSLLIT